MKNLFRVVIPRNVDSFITLSGDILTKHDADGAASILGHMDMADFQAKHTIAEQSHEEGKQMNRDKETAIELRNHALGIEPEQKSYTPGTVLYYVTSIRDYLLGIFIGTEQKLGDWGYEVDSSVKGGKKVVIPRSAPKLISLAKNILAKHVDDDIDSILDTIDMVDFQEKYDEAVLQHNLARKLNRDKETIFQVRNNALGFKKGQRRITPGTLLSYVVGTRDVLIGHFKGMEQQLGDWGFEVNTSQSPNPPDPEVDTLVLGVVTDGVTFDPIGGVEINFHTSTGLVQATSSPTGAYSATLDIAETESVPVDITQAGYMPYNEMHNITAGEDNELNFSLMPL